MGVGIGRVDPTPDTVVVDVSLKTALEIIKNLLHLYLWWSTNVELDCPKIFRGLIERLVVPSEIRIIAE